MKFIYLILAFLIAGVVQAQKQKQVPPLQVVRGELVYNPDSATGDRIPDFSFCGYKSSEAPIPDVPVKIVVGLVKGDATATIQKAIDDVGALSPDKNGFRGAILLERGTYELAGQILITKSGIVLRGSGTENGTVILGRGIDRDGMIRVFGKNDRAAIHSEEITDDYVPVNANRVTVANGSSFQAGDQIIVKRPSTWAWIDALETRTFGGGISALGWKPGDADLYFDRKVAAVQGNFITLDVPLTTSIDKKYGGGSVTKYQWGGRISKVGIENMTLISDYDKSNPKDDYHRWMAITFDNIEDAWVRQVGFIHFAGSAVYILEGARRITVEDCISREPISEIGGQRRYTFFTRGQQTLFQRCYAANGYHDFSTGHCAAGPNAFVQCVSSRPYSFSGAIDKWASGVLFDVVEVDGNAIRLGNRGQDGQGAGWAAANNVLWNCNAARIDCYKPPTAQNWSFGSWSQFSGDGYWSESNNHLTPRSLFYAQLKARLNRNVDAQAAILEMGTEASSSPSVDVAQALTREARKPRQQLISWIADASKRNPIPVSAKNARSLLPVAPPVRTTWPSMNIRIQNGWIVNGPTQEVITGKRQEVPWWNGGVERSDLESAKLKLSLTRFVPGRVGAGLTDDLKELVQTMKEKNIVGIEQHYGLWYDRRRDDHERVRRMDGEVWPPFYELPFSRSGRDTAWDGLSKYDLTKYNPWYWGRLKTFANLADANGLVLIHENYFQHNIIEAGAHYADFPWRTANNINHTGFVEPVNYAGDKRIFYADQFYDLSNPVRKKLHQQYIEQCLNNFKENSNVIQFISEEFTGPLHFVQFWLQTIGEWEKKNRKQLVGLSTTKDVQDAILSDSKYSPLVDIIDIKYWHYQADGKLYAPEGGKNLAPRQWARLLKPRATSFDQVYRAVREYRTRYPGKSVMYSGDNFDRFGWAVFIAGGSLPMLPASADKGLLQAAARMLPADGISKYALAGNDGIIVYCDAPGVQLDLSKYPGSYKIRYLSTVTGTLMNEPAVIQGGKLVELSGPAGTGLIWLSK